METTVLTLHIGTDAVLNSTVFGTLLNIDTETQTIGYTFDEAEFADGDQVALPNYNMLSIDGQVLVGWCENAVGTGPVFTDWYEPYKDKKDLWAVWANADSITAGGVRTVVGTTTTVTPYDSLSAEQKGYADIAIGSFNLAISSQVSEAVGTIITSELVPMITTKINEIAPGIVEDYLGTIIGSITYLEQYDAMITGSVETLIGSVSLLEQNGDLLSDWIGTMFAQEGPVFGSIADISGSVSVISGNIADINTSLGTINTNLGTINELLKPGGQVLGSITDIAGSLNTLETSYDLTVGSLETLTTDYGVTVGSLSIITGDVSNLNGRVTNVEGNVSSLDIRIGTNEQDIQNIIGSLNQQGTNISTIFDYISLSSNLFDFILGSIYAHGTNITNIENAMSISSQELNLTIASVIQLGGEINTLNNYMSISSEQVNQLIGSFEIMQGDITDLSGRLSTENIEGMIENAITSNRSQVSSTFQVSTISTICSVEVPSDVRTVVKLKDYKDTQAYTDTFDSLGTIAWYNNGSLVTDDTPVNNNSILLGTVLPLGTFTVYALPVVQTGDDEVLPDSDPPASNFGATYLYIGTDILYDSHVSYNPEITINSGATVNVVAGVLTDSNGGSGSVEFMGWCMVDTDGNPIGYDGMVDQPWLTKVENCIFSKEPCHTFVADSDYRLAAVFKGDPVTVERLPIEFEPSHEPKAYICTYHSNGYDIGDDYDNSLFKFNLESWAPIGNSSDFKAGLLENRVLVVTDDNMHPEYYINGIGTAVSAVDLDDYPDVKSAFEDQQGWLGIPTPTLYDFGDPGVGNGFDDVRTILNIIET